MLLKEYMKKRGGKNLSREEIAIIGLPDKKPGWQIVYQNMEISEAIAEQAFRALNVRKERRSKNRANLKLRRIAKSHKSKFS